MSSKAEAKESGEIEGKPGQKFVTPSPGNGERVFYETLYQQRPSSIMAQDWCVLYGILSAKEAEKILAARGGVIKGKAVNSVATKSSNSPVKASKSASSGSRKRKVIVDGDDDADIGFSKGSAWEGRGSMGMEV